MLPTYNEAENIEIIIKKIHEVRKNFQIVVVDDNSPDGTGEILERLRKEIPGIHIIHRRDRRGRGRAGIVGFKECLKLAADVIIEMDADLSHNPEFIPVLLNEIDNADVVIASRYINDGEDRRDFIRRTISRVANYYIKTICGINIYDSTSGFRAFRSSILQAINLNELKSIGPSIVQEVLLKCIEKNAKIIEIPYSFYDRNAGKSKLSLLLLLRTLFNITKMGIRFRFTGSHN